LLSPTSGEFNLQIGIFTLKLIKLIKLTCVLLMTLSVSSANATLIFDFSFTNDTSGGSIVTGEIAGLLDNATSSASSVAILTNSSSFGVGQFDISQATTNLFTVSSGVLTSWDFLSFGVLASGSAFVADSSLILLSNPNPAAGLTFNANTVSSSNTSASSFVVTRRLPMATVSEPSTLVIFALGMIGLASRRFKKNP
jgi:hypothetical protein